MRALGTIEGVDFDVDVSEGGKITGKNAQTVRSILRSGRIMATNPFTNETTDFDESPEWVYAALSIAERFAIVSGLRVFGIPEPFAYRYESGVDY